ncbi:MAG: ABC transporter ATP-binding protein, partial [Acidimicrobiales bacterium]
MPPAVHLRAALALIGAFPALAGVDLDVAPGEVVWVQGPNGAGKTSLLRACAGLLPVSSGEAVVLGRDVRADRRAVRRQVAMIGHAGFLYDDLTVADNVRFAVRAAGGRSAAVDPALARVGLDGRLRKV